jgi:uracil-DNA glycosylase
LNGNKVKKFYRSAELVFYSRKADECSQPSQSCCIFGKMNALDQLKDEIRIESSWKTALYEAFQSPSFAALVAFLKTERARGECIYPPGPRIFAAFDRTPFDKVKVVIIGQDPYHGPGQANGLCFSVGPGIAKPPSLQNIFKELQTDIGIPIPDHGQLEAWADQGVLLMNATLTVRAHQAASHQRKGWEQFTDAVIRALSEQQSGLVFLLWGNAAKEKGAHIDRSRHHVLEAPHPSPLARGGFFGCKHFSRTNAILTSQGQNPIDWTPRTPIESPIQ